MLFNSPIFLFIFLPLTLLLYFLAGSKLRNVVLLLASIVFYFWGQPDFIIVLAVLIYLNFILARIIDQYKITNRGFVKKVLFFSIVLNLSALAYYKYRFFILSNLIFLSHSIPGSETVLNTKTPFLPLAISFFTFHAISYQIDVFRNQSSSQKSLFKLSLYFLMFPHLLAGPILRYHQIQDQLDRRSIKIEDFAYAVNRFVFGLAKKVLVADRLAAVANEIFAIPAQRIDASTAWLGLICFTLQIYFDFSAYSDMAISLAKMFGFDFPENFNYPYISSSVREFWRRWHITLANWFRDYVYIPLGGSRKGEFKTYLNIFIVFTLCGLWHGASWNFLIWGSIHGILLIIERLKNSAFINFLWKPLRHIYTLLVITLSWVFFRTDNLTQAVIYFKTLFGFGEHITKYRTLQYFITADLMVVICIAIIIALPIRYFIDKFTKKFSSHNFFDLTYKGFGFSYFVFILILSLITMAAQTYRPFIYFKF